MNIRPKNIPKFQGGGVPQWYLDRYGNRTALLGWNLNQRYNYANDNLMANDHRNAGNLDMVYQKNLAYTGTPGAISSDIQAFYDSDGNGMSAEDFVNFYNNNAEKIRSHWAKDLTYNQKTAGDHNRLFRRMFLSRSNMSESPGSDYNIGYLLGQTKGGYDIQDIEGSSTWLRRMDLYENEFDPNNPDSNRLHEITLKDGTKAIVYKKANGDIGLLPKQEEPKPEDPTKPEDPNKSTGGLNIFHKEGGYGFDWNKIALGLQLSLPGLYENIGLGLALDANNRIFNEKLKGIRPNLVQPYLTHRQVVGDEATKLAYYRRGAEGVSRASQPFTADADRLMAYLNEAYKNKNELEALGDLADNLEIRRTSDESNQHQWANTQRRTEVANENLTQLNYANAAKHDLKAQHIAANHASWDNFLKAREYRARQQQERAKEYQRNIWAMQDLYDLATNSELANLSKAYDEAYNADPNSDATKKAADAYRAKMFELKKRMYENALQRENSFYTWFGKLGMKITKKKKDDLLYKSAKDVVDHFRKMSKMSDDSTQRSRHPGSRFKLTSHPKKMQQGGLAPFVVYTPVAMGGETSVTRSSETGSSSSKNDSAKETLDLVKNLFKEVRGLPVDANNVYTYMQKFFDKAKAFGTELSTDDIASMYLQSMQQINNLKHSQDIYEKARAFATQQESLNEFAVDAMGNFIVQDKDGKLSKENSWQKVLESGKNPLTNEQLLYMRAYDLDLAFYKGDNYIMNTIFNGTGINKIGAQIKALAGSIGSSDSKIDGITKIESNKIKAGLELLANAPEGYYKITLENKTQLEQVRAAFNFIKSQLSRSQLAILESHGGADLAIVNALNSEQNITNNISISPLTGKAATGTNGNTGGKGGAESSAGLAFVLGQGPRELIDFNTGTSNAIRVLGIKGTLQTHSKENLGLGATLLDATKSLEGAYMLWGKATFGGSKLNPQAYSHIILNDSTIMGVDLPYTTDINGNEIPDFQMLKKMELADQEISLNHIEDPLGINAIYLKYGLPPKFDNNGNLNELKYKRFAAILATLDEQSLQNKESVLSDEIALAGEVERDLYEEAMKKQNKDYSLSDGMWITGWGKDLLYKGTIFVPYSEDVAFAAISSGQPFKLNLPDNSALIQQMQYASKASTYKAPETLSQIKNN